MFFHYGWREKERFSSKNEPDNGLTFPRVRTLDGDNGRDTEAVCSREKWTEK